ncbi:hypothetical protein [Microcoleus sp.]|uniref:hypothetical protein n=1 Tax=Microcoleus sp. TaxID=44472 RepID=UPI003592FC92
MTLMLILGRRRSIPARRTVRYRESRATSGRSGSLLPQQIALILTNRRLRKNIDTLRPEGAEILRTKQL